MIIPGTQSWSIKIAQHLLEALFTEKNQIWLRASIMGNADTKLNFRKAVVQLTSKTQVIKISSLLPMCFFFPFSQSFKHPFWSSANRRGGRYILGPILVRECRQCTGYIHSDTRARDKSPQGRGSVEFSYAVLQGGGETRQGGRQQLSNPTGTSDGFELLQTLDQAASIYLRRLRLEGILLVQFAWEGRWGECTSRALSTQRYFR